MRAATQQSHPVRASRALPRPSRASLTVALRAAAGVAVLALCAFPSRTYQTVASGSGFETDVIVVSRISWQFDDPVVVLGRLGPAGPRLWDIVYHSRTRHPASSSVDVVTESTRKIDSR